MFFLGHFELTGVVARDTAWSNPATLRPSRRVGFWPRDWGVSEDPGAASDLSPCAPRAHVRRRRTLV